MMTRTQSTPVDREALAALVRRARAGDDAARADIFRATMPMAWRLVSRFVNQRADIEDVLQLAYIECFRSLASFRGESAFTTWLGSICVRTAIAHHKRERRQQQDPALLSIVSHHTPEEQALERERARALAKILDELSLALRVPFVLHVLEGYDIDTVAAMSDSSVAATYKAVERARSRIEKAARAHPLLRKYLGGGEP